ncbi:MAG: Uma2 family endonuclease [Phycisphaerales bacterium]|nr:Uma2 family endonuclease [Phycisphaerales bacterium]
MKTQIAKISAEQFHHIEVPGGIRLELDDGELIVSPSPRSHHSRVVALLIGILYAHIEAHDLGQLFTELDTVFDLFSVRRPDLMFVTKKQSKKMDPEGPASSNDAELIVEVLSPGSERIDRVTKFQQYAKAGIRYYWILDPHQRTFEAYTLAGKSYRLQSKGRGNATVQAKPFADLAIPLQKLWWQEN